MLLNVRLQLGARLGQVAGAGREVSLRLFQAQSKFFDFFLLLVDFTGKLLCPLLLLVCQKSVGTAAPESRKYFLNCASTGFIFPDLEKLLEHVVLLGSDSKHTQTMTVHKFERRIFLLEALEQLIDAEIAFTHVRIMENHHGTVGKLRQPRSEIMLNSFEGMVSVDRLCCVNQV